MRNDHRKSFGAVLAIFSLVFIWAGFTAVGMHETARAGRAEARQPLLKIIKLDGCEYVAPNGFSETSYFIHKANGSNKWHSEEGR